MTILDPKKLALFLQTHTAESNEVMTNSDELANKLIKNLQIQMGFGLAGFLNVDTSLDNYTAVRVWVSKQLIKLQGDLSDGDMAWVYNELEHRFYDCVPEMG